MPLSAKERYQAYKAASVDNDLTFAAFMGFVLPTLTTLTQDSHPDQPTLYQYSKGDIKGEWAKSKRMAMEFYRWQRDRLARRKRHAAHLVAADIRNQNRANAAGITTQELHCLSHTLGAQYHIKTRDWGFRNYYWANPESDMMDALQSLEAKGFVRRSEETKTHVIFHATQLGCTVAGLNEKQTARALGD